MTCRTPNCTHPAKTACTLQGCPGRAMAAVFNPNFAHMELRAPLSALRKAREVSLPLTSRATLFSDNLHHTAHSEFGA